MTNDQFVTEWVIDTVKKKYPEDIALVVSHTTLRIDGGEPCISYFVPITDKGNGLSRTFILDGVGYDIWGIPWERLERFAELEEYNISVLADGEVLYAKDSGWKKRFEELKAKLKGNLADNARSRERALSSYAEAKELYGEMQFASDSDVYMLAGYVIDYLARAVAFRNHIYFKGSQTEQLKELCEAVSGEKIPQGFSELYLDVINVKGAEQKREKCRQIINTVRRFLEESYPDHSRRENNYQDLSDWYAELAYTWLRLRRYAENGDFVKLYMWGIFLQNELNEVCGDFRLPKPELMECYDKENPDVFIARANALEKQIREAIIKGGGVINEYGSREEFLNENI